jgi:hypothetical protein
VCIYFNFISSLMHAKLPCLYARPGQKSSGSATLFNVFIRNGPYCGAASYLCGSGSGQKILCGTGTSVFGSGSYPSLYQAKFCKTNKSLHKVKVTKKLLQFVPFLIIHASMFNIKFGAGAVGDGASTGAT